MDYVLIEWRQNMNRQLRKITAVVSAAAVALSGVSFGSLCLTAYAESDGIQTALDVSKGSITITDSSVSGYAGDGTSVTTIDPDGYIITGTTTEYTITVSGTQNITLDGVDIDVSQKSDTGAFVIEYNNTGDVTITLADDSVNKLQSGQSCAGLQKNEWDGVVGKLTIKGGEKGTGSLTAIGGDCSAGIGGGGSDPKGTVSNYGDADYIRISGGIVTAPAAIMAQA